MPSPRSNTPKAKKATTPRTPRKATSPDASSIAVKRAQIKGEDGAKHDPYAPTAWGGPDALGTLTELTLPSGQKCLAQRPGPEGLAMAGLLDDLDVLASQAPKQNGNRQLSKLKAEAALRDPKALAEAVKLMNRVLVYVVVKPELTDEPEDPSHKVAGNIYPSSVSLQDKTYVFNWAVGGTADLATFREGLEASVADMAARQNVEHTSE